MRKEGHEKSKLKRKKIAEIYKRGTKLLRKTTMEKIRTQVEKCIQKRKGIKKSRKLMGEKSWK